jgi:hypothetical protein
VSKKSRRLIRSGTTAKTTQPEAVAEVVEPEPATFFMLPDTEPVPVAEAELHRLMKLWRHGRATRTIGQVLSDGYVALFSVLLLSAMVTSTVINAQQGMTGCTTQACDTGRLLVPTAVTLAGYALAVAISRLFGPVLASAAEGSWLMEAPISRSRLLRGRLVIPLLAALVVPVLITGLAAALSGMDWVSVTIWSVAAGVGAMAMVAVAAQEQTRERDSILAVLQGIWTAAALLVGLVVIAVAAGWLSASWITTAAAVRPVMYAVAVVSVVLTVVMVVSALRRLDLIRRARLVSGGSLVSGMQGAMFALDFGLIRDILVERKAMAKGHVTPTVGRGSGLTALIWRDAQRLVRAPGVFIGLVMSLLVPYATDALRLSQLNPLISGLALVAALVPFLGSLRVLTRTGGLARMMPFKTGELRAAAMAIPGVMALLWGLAATPAFIGIASSGADRDIVTGMSAAMVTAAAGLFGAVRWVTAKKPDFGQPMMATASGALPPTLIFNLVRGFDMVALITAPLILGAPVYWSAGIALVVFLLLRSPINMADLQAEQEAAQRELASAKAGARTGAGPAKTKIPAPRR